MSGGPQGASKGGVSGKREKPYLEHGQRGLKALWETGDKLLDVKRSEKINDIQDLADRNVSIFIIKIMAYDSLEKASR